MEAAGPAQWTEEDIKKLFITMKKSIANRARDKIWSVGLKALDWEIVAFRPFTAEECRAKWDEIMKKLRKIKTLTELIVDAESAMDSRPNLFEDSQIQIPKKPVAANAIYFSEAKEKLKKKNPGLSSRDLMKLANEKYKKLPLQNKEKYVLQAEKELQQYKRRMAKLSRKHPDELAKLKKSASRKSTNPKKAHGAQTSTPKKKGTSATIPLNGYNLFCREQKSHMTGIPQKDITSVWSRRWKSLSKEEKDEYSQRCKELKRNHMTPSKTIFPGEPKRKLHSISGLYCKEKLAEMTEGKDRQQLFAEVCRQSKNLSNEEKERYQAQIDKDLRIYKQKLQRWFQKLTPGEQVEYLRLNKSKKKYLQCKQPMQSHRTSDSEDEELDDSGEDVDDYGLTIIQIDDENEEEDMKMLDLY